MAEDEIVVYKRGEVQKKIDPTIIQFVMLDDIRVGLNKLNEHFKKDEFEGYEDSRTLSVTEKTEALNLVREPPFTPWITGYAFNDGPNTAYIAINYKAEWITIKNKESSEFDHKGADRRIEHIQYRCDPGETAMVRILGKY